MYTNQLPCTGVPYSLNPTNKNKDAPAQSFCNDDEHGKAIDLIVSMMKNGDGDIQTLKQPKVMMNGNTLNFIIVIHTQKY
jgi:hypothetical protein